jgi:hypothetical protein
MTRQEEILKGLNESWGSKGINATSNTSVASNGITISDPSIGRAVVLNFTEGINVPKFTSSQVSSLKNVTDGQLVYITDGSPAGLYCNINSTWELIQSQDNPYGSFYDTTNQSVAIDGIAAMTYNTTVLSYGISIVSGSRIKFDYEGVYNIQFSTQFERSSGSTAKQLVIWLRLNGNDIPNSSTRITFQGSAGHYFVAAWNFFQLVSKNDYCEIMWTQNDSIGIAFDPGNLTIPYPAIPSIILTVNKVN